MALTGEPLIALTPYAPSPSLSFLSRVRAVIHCLRLRKPRLP